MTGKAYQRFLAAAQQLANAFHEPYMILRDGFGGKLKVESQTFLSSPMGRRRYNGVVEGAWVFPEVEYLKPRRRNAA